MTGLDKLLQAYAPPPVPEGLAERAAAAAAGHAQEPRHVEPSRRRDRRGSWLRRPLLAGTAALGLAFTSAVATTYVSGGRIQIPVVQSVISAVPALDRAVKSRAEPVRQVAEAPASAVAQPTEDQSGTTAAGQRPWGDPRATQVLQRLQANVDQRREAGLPTPRADRIERQAETIVARRQAKGLPAPPVDRVKTALALRELKRMKDQRQGGVSQSISPEQMERISERLPPDRRARFEQLTPEQQEALVSRVIERRRLRRAMRAADPVDNSVPNAQPSEGFSEQPR